jgi:cyclophilin family peptidyl-prolyl cis-trans isomerase
MSKLSKTLCLMAILFVLLASARAMQQTAPDTKLLTNPDAPELNARAPDVYTVRLETSKGTVVVEVTRSWAPKGADRFYNLVRAGYYDGVKFHRIRAGNWAQFGVNGDPKISTAWRNKTIPDDPAGQSNTRGTIAFAFAVPNGRTTQVFVNLKDNSSTHDSEPFVPFGQVTSGMEIVDSLYADYGERAGGGIRGGKQDVLFNEGNAWLEKNFPKLDYVSRAVITP